jgi:WD40 repeat protein
MPDDDHVVVATFAGWKTLASRPDRVPAWSLVRIDTDSSAREPFAAEGQHLGAVMALAISPDGRSLASSDTFGGLHFWNMADRSLVASRRQNVGLSALAWSPDGQTLVAGSSLSPLRGNKAVWQLWRVANRKVPALATEEVVERDVFAIAVNPRGGELAYTQGSEIVLHRLGVGGPTDRLRGLSRPVLRVAFAVQPPEYRVAIGTRRAGKVNGNENETERIPWEHAFNLSQVKLEAARELRENDWLDNSSWRGEWSIRSERDEAGEVHWLYQGEQRAARLPLQPSLHGRPSATCWIPDRDGRPLAVAIGTSLQGNIFVFRLAATGAASIMRQFRGHEGGVRSIGVSRDRRYLCSGADDGTVRIWNLAGFEGGDESVNRWGARFEIRDGKLVASEVRDDGPLYFRGVRTDDLVHSLAWPVGQDVRHADQPEAMLQQLRATPWDTQVVFDCRRRNTQVEGFQMLPAWQPLTSLFVSENREWACLTPAWYYDASFDGHKLFGWQINRGVDLLPEFFMAAQFRRALERPGVLNKLLGAGSLPAALRAAPDPPPGDGQDAVLPQYRLKPRLEILAPRPDEHLAGQQVTIRVKVVVRDGLELIPPKAFANGVVATARRLVQQQTTPGGKEYIYEWNAAIPSDPQVLIQVVASTDAEAAEFQSVRVRGTAVEPTRLGRVFVLAAGVNDYRDAQIQHLDFAANNARRVVETFQQATSGTDATLLLDEYATRPMWTVIAADYADRLRKEATPDDLLVFFLSGHGVRDEQTDGYYFVTANARFVDLKSRQFAECMSFGDFAAFADVPCRKLAILDTCHSGAVQQPLRQQDLKSAIRALQDDVVFTMTASDGSQEAAEDRGRQLGRFTARLVEALQGAADEAAHGGDANGLVSLREASSYVRASVAADSSRDDRPQHPTAGPIDLLEFAEFPLSRR